MSQDHTKRRLPPLRSLQVFEVAARRGTFTGAAEELGVSQGAVSRQVQELEQALGAPLFARSGPRLKLTAIGEALGETATRAMDLLQEGVDQARPASPRRFVTLSMLPSVAAKWLAPRLERFIDAHPEIDLRVTASRQLVDLAADDVDAAIRYGEGAWPGVDAALLTTETITPVCAPDYARRLGLRRPNDLDRATLLHSDIRETWRAWFDASGLAEAPAGRGPRLGDDAATLQAAIDGQGVALGRSLLIADDLRVGRLIAPFSVTLRASYSYWFVTPRQSQRREAVDTVKRWLFEQFQSTPVAGPSV